MVCVWGGGGTNICCWLTLKLPHSHRGNSNVHLQHMSIQLMSVFHQKTGFSQISQPLFMFQCNEHVEMDKFLCSLACTWMAIIDSQ